MDPPLIAINCHRSRVLLGSPSFDSAASFSGDDVFQRTVFPCPSGTSDRRHQIHPRPALEVQSSAHHCRATPVSAVICRLRDRNVKLNTVMQRRQIGRSTAVIGNVTWQQVRHRPASSCNYHSVIIHLGQAGKSASEVTDLIFLHITYH